MSYAPDDIVLVEAVRTPSGRGKASGGLADVHPVDLLAQTLTALVDRSGIDPGIVDDVIVGCVSQVGEQSATPGRMAWLGAGFPAHVPAATIDRKCGSSQQAVSFAAQALRAGDNDIVIAGGVESMSRVVMGSARMGADPYGEQVATRFAPGLVSQGVASELVSERWGLTRDDLDSYAVRSHDLAATTLDAGSFARETFAVSTPAGALDRDETIRAGSTTEKLGALATVFRTDELAARFPGVTWSTTAGNSSQIADGASAVLLMRASTAHGLCLTPRARIRAVTAVGSDPLLMLTGPIPATEKILSRTGVALGDVDHVELNEAFASVPLAWQRETGYDQDRLNPRGGAIALGHALGSSGTRLLTTMLHALEEADQTLGLQLMCEAGGMANATLIERL